MMLTNHPSRAEANSSQVPETALVVIPNFNGEPTIVECLESVKRQTYQPLDVVVVDNASTDRSVEMIRAQFPDFRIVQSGYNAGWGVACNMGMSAAPSRYICLLNNDAYMEDDCIEQLVQSIRKDPAYGSCASRVLLWNEPGTAEVCGLVIYPDGSSVGRGRLGPADRYMEEEEVFCANDCCCLYRREMIDDIGDYDSDFFMYCDETEMGWRHQLAGWKCIYNPRAVAYHLHSQAAGSYSAFKAYHVERNRIFVCLKYFPVWRILLSFCISCYRYIYQFYFAVTHGKGALAHYRKNNTVLSGLWILWRAHRDAFMKLPTMWRRRKQMCGIRRLARHEFSRLFKKYGINTRQMASYE